MSKVKIAPISECVMSFKLFGKTVMYGQNAHTELYYCVGMFTAGNMSSVSLPPSIVHQLAQHVAPMSPCHYSQTCHEDEAVGL